MLETAQILRSFAYDKWGGTENVVWNSVLGMRDHNIVSEILATMVNSPQGFEVRDGITIRRFERSYPCWFLSAAKRARLDQSMGDTLAMGLYKYLLNARDYDLFHLHCDGLLGRMAAAAVIRRRKPYIVSFHRKTKSENILEDNAPSAAGGVCYGNLTAFLRNWPRDFARNASGLICTGRHEAGMLREKYPDKKVLFLPNGVDVERFAEPVSIDIRKEFKIPPLRKIILCVSRLDEVKNQKMVIRLGSSLVEDGENIHVLLIGRPAPGGYLNELYRLINDLQISDRVTIVPGLAAGDERLVAAYQEAGAFVMPSRNESFGLVVLEAWAAGVPVIASSVPGLRELVSDGGNALLFNSDDLSGLLGAYRALEKNNLSERLIENGLREVRMHYSNKVVNTRLAEFYRECIEDFKL